MRTIVYRMGILTTMIGFITFIANNNLVQKGTTSLLLASVYISKSSDMLNKNTLTP